MAEEIPYYRIVGQINDTPLRQRLSDGYWSGTDIAKADGDEWSHYRQNQKTEDYLIVLERRLRIPRDLLIDIVNDGPNSHRGSWVHKYVAIHESYWCSPEVQVSIIDLIIGHIEEEAEATGQSFEEVLFNRILAPGKRTYESYPFYRDFQRNMLGLIEADKRGIEKDEALLKMIRPHGAGLLPKMYTNIWNTSLTEPGYDEARQRKKISKAKNIGQILTKSASDTIMGIAYGLSRSSKTLESFLKEFESCCGNARLFMQDVVKDVTERSWYQQVKTEGVQLNLFGS